MSLTPVPSSEPRPEPSCESCSAPLAGDQRYCLSCGHPVSPVRLPFLDVLGDEPQVGGTATPFSIAAVPGGYAAVVEPAGAGAYGSLRRYSGLFGLLSVLLLAILAGLLVGHWVTQSKAPDRQVLEVKGLPSAAVAASPLASSAAAGTGAGAGAGATSSVPSSPPKAAPSTSKAAARTEAHEAQEAKAIERKPTPKAVKQTPTQLKKLGSTTGRKHEEEVNALGAKPIETG